MAPSVLAGSRTVAAAHGRQRSAVMPALAAVNAANGETTAHRRFSTAVANAACSMLNAAAGATPAGAAGAPRNLRAASVVAHRQNCMQHCVPLMVLPAPQRQDDS
ncbi:hypothetical protein NPIL_438391 [Nephila pilipes]|uniref:Uncharacterized protein n=1 Tax=Nephila pilipes TaxID=299642 RepID=A0A8X6U0Q4_NEPPI|nr:hypothetical protein NPIL_438391 [Nephila pilipes]